MLQPYVEFFVSKSEEGEILLHYFCRTGSVSDLMFLHDMINDKNRSVLLKHNSDLKQCVHIIASSDVDAIVKFKVLLLWGADINAKELKEGNTPLHIAVCVGNYELVDWLCHQANINMEALNDNYMTPYHLAYLRKDARMISILKENGALCKIPCQSENNSDDEA